MGVVKTCAESKNHSKPLDSFPWKPASITIVLFQLLGLRFTLVQDKELRHSALGVQEGVTYIKKRTRSLMQVVRSELSKNHYTLALPTSAHNSRALTCFTRIAVWMSK